MKKLIIFFLFPCFILGQTKIGSDIDGESAGDQLGNSVSLSSDGNIIAIGAYLNDENGLGSGHVRVYRNINGVWEQVGADIDGESVGDQSGLSVSLSSDGNIVAIGAPYNAGNGSGSGHIRVYRNNNGVWEQVGADIDGENTNDHSGVSVSLSSDGNIVAIGANRNDGNGSGSGHVRVYRNNNGVWEQIGADIDGENARDSSGFSVSLSSDGSIVAIGAISNYENGLGSGHVRIYRNNNGVWEQVGADINGEIGENSGYSVSLSSDGSIVAIGAPYNSSGRVRVYRNNNEAWQQIGADINGENTAGFSGSSVSLSSEGNIVAIGAYSNYGSGPGSGHVRIYRNINEVWKQVGADIDGENNQDYSGSSVSLSSDGSIVAIGAPYNSENGYASGHVRVYNLSSVLSVDKNKFIVLESNLYPNPTSNYFKIKLSQNVNLQSIIIYNSLGKKVLISYRKDISVKTLATGFYLVKIITDKGTDSRKLIVE